MSQCCALREDVMFDAGTSVAFMERLSALPLREWHRIAMATPKEISRELECALTGALDASANAFEVWRVRDGVATLLFRFECAEGAASHSTARDVGAHSLRHGACGAGGARERTARRA